MKYLWIPLLFFAFSIHGQSKADQLREEAHEYYDSGNYFKTAETYQRAIKLDSRMNKCMVNELSRSYAHLNKYDSALIYWEKLYRSRNYGPVLDFNKMEYENLEYFEHSEKDSIWDPIRETKEWIEVRDRIRQSFEKNLDEVIWKYRDVMDSLYWVNSDLEKERLDVLNSFGMDSEEMKAFNERVEQHRSYSVEQAKIILNELGFPTRKQIGNEGNEYFLRVLNWMDRALLDQYWREIEEAYLSDKLHESQYNRLKEIQKTN